MVSSAPCADALVGSVIALGSVRHVQAAQPLCLECVRVAPPAGRPLQTGSIAAVAQRALGRPATAGSDSGIRYARNCSSILGVDVGLGRARRPCERVDHLADVRHRPERRRGCEPRPSARNARGRRWGRSRPSIRPTLAVVPSSRRPSFIASIALAAATIALLPCPRGECRHGCSGPCEVRGHLVIARCRHDQLPPIGDAWSMTKPKSALRRARSTARAPRSPVSSLTVRTRARRSREAAPVVE